MPRLDDTTLCSEEEEALLDPKCWSPCKKTLHLAIVCSLVFATPLASAIHTPALSSIQRDLHVGPALVSLSVSAYVLGMAAGPLLIAPLSQTFGRLSIYRAGAVLLVCANAGCALAPSFTCIVAFRFVAGCAGASAVTQGSGTIADIVEPQHRAKSVAWVSFGTVWAPMMGTAVGGRVAEGLGWRSCFWLLVGVGILNAIVTFAFMSETSLTHIRRRRRGHMDATELKSRTTAPSLGCEEAQAPPAEESTLRLLARATKTPFRLAAHPVCSAVTAISAFFYSIQVFQYVDVPSTYAREYGFSPSQTGLAFLGTGIGMSVGLLTFGMLGDGVMLRLAGHGPRKPEHRLPLMMASAALVAVGLASYALSARPSTPWIVPIVANGVMGAGLYATSVAAATFLIDLSPSHAVDSAALLGIVRFTCGAVVSAISEYVVGMLGRTLLKGVFAFEAACMVPLIYLLYVNGEKLRTRHPIREVRD